jgi:hypothetical protein
MPKVNKNKGRKIEQISSGRDIVYPEIAVQVCMGDQELTYEQATKLLGWQRPKKGEEFENFLFKDSEKVTVACTNNDQNRPFSLSHALNWMYEILNGNWRLNGETLIIGETGMCLDCQHRLVGFCLAVEDYRKNKTTGPEPTLPCIIVFGVKEDRETVNTLNTGKPRSLSDAIYASGIFDGFNKKEMKTLSRMADYAIRLVWQRTRFEEFIEGGRTHAESLSFLETHPGILDCVRFVFEEKAVKRYIGEGYMAGLMYLMSRCKTVAIKKEGDGYFQQDLPSEESTDDSMLSKAEEFVTLLATQDEKLKALETPLKKFAESETGGSLMERSSLLIKAWNKFRSRKPITGRDLVLKYRTLDDGFKVLTEYPTLGGIDRLESLD